MPEEWGAGQERSSQDGKDGLEGISWVFPAQFTSCRNQQLLSFHIWGPKTMLTTWGSLLLMGLIAWVRVEGASVWAATRYPQKPT